MGGPRSQGIRRWVVPARRGPSVGWPPLVFASLLLLGCAETDEQQEPCAETMENCATLRTECADDSIVAWCDGQPPCVVRCVEVCEAWGGRWLGACGFSATLDREVCGCE